MQGHVLELQVPQREMLHDFVTVHGTRSIMMGPPLTKFGADLFEIFNGSLDSELEEAIASWWSAEAQTTLRVLVQRLAAKKG